MKTHFRHLTYALLSGIALLCLSNLIFGVGRLPFLGPDEPRYAEVALEMLQSGDWITPRLAGIPWLEKPALLYWIAAIGYAAFGVSEFSARLGVTVIASAGAFVLFVFGSKVRSPLFGYLAATILLSMGLWIAFGRGATFDMPLAVATEFALLGFFWWERRAEGQANFGWYSCCFAIGLAVLAKGLVGIVLPVAIIGTYLVATRRLRLLTQQRSLLVLGVLIFVATTATWYGPMFARHGRLFFDEFFVAHHFQRYLSDRYRHPQPFYFFFVVALAGCFPWTAYLFSSAARDVRRWRELGSNHEHRLRLFLWIWVLIPILFFSLSGSKLPGYILPVFPPIALLIALELTERQPPWRTLATALAVILLAAGIWLLGGRELGLSSGERMSLVAVAVAVVVGYLATRFRVNEVKAAVVLSFGVGALILAAVYVAFPGLARRESVRNLYAAAEVAARRDERLVFYLDHDQGINFYSTSLPLRDDRSELITLRHGGEIARLLEDRGFESLLVMCYERWSGGLFINERLETELLATQSRRIGCSPGCDWVLLRVSRGSIGRGEQSDRR